MGEANNLWRCNDCGFLFDYPKFDPDSRKDRCPACGSSDIAISMGVTVEKHPFKAFSNKREN